MRTIKESDKTEALSPKFRDAFVFSLKTPELMLAYLNDEIRSAGFSIHVKKAGSFKDTMTTTLPGVRQMWLGHNWASKTPTHQAIVKAHELVHVTQERILGTEAYVAKYANARGRWTLEMQAYAVSILAGRALGRDMKDEPERVAKSLWTNYGPWLLFRESAVTRPTIEVLSKV
jgi:hypothetical protein